MRTVLSLSMPVRTAQQIKRRAKQRGYKSVSAYIQNIVAEDEHLITEEELIKSMKLAEKEYKAGKTIVVKSLAELL